MKIQGADLFPKWQRRKRFPFACFLCFLGAQHLLAADPSAVKIEEAQRAFQERHKMIFGSSVSWPNNALGQPAPEYPPDGFYEADLSNSVQAASLVADFATKFDESHLLWNFTSAKGGDIEGVAGGYDATVPSLGDKLRMPLARDVTADNYPIQFNRLIHGICEAKYVVVMAEQVGSVGKGTPVEKRSGGSFDEGGCDIFRSSNWPDYDAPEEEQNSGTFTVGFQQTLVPGHYHVSVCDSYDEPAAWSTGHWTVGGVAANQVSDPVEWIHWYYCPEQDPPWCFWSFWEKSPCDTPNEIPVGTELTEYSVNNKTIIVPWELEVTSCADHNYQSYIIQLSCTQTFTCEEHLQRARSFWNSNSWEDDVGGSIGARVTADDGHWLGSWRGRIYANLTNFDGTARCYLSVQGGDFTICIAQGRVQPNSLQPDDTPVATDMTWHFFESVTPGTEWTSDILGNDIPPVADCGEQWDWFIIHQVVIVTPDFQYNIENCEPCSACEDQCTPGSTSASLTGGALNLNIGLGRDSYGKLAGELSICALRAIPSQSTPSALAYHTSVASEVLQGTNGALRQVRNSQALLDIVTTTNTNYQIRFYAAADAGTTNSSGFYVPSGSPFKVVAVEDPDASGATFNRLRVTESEGGVDRVSDFVWSEEEQAWTLSTGNGLRQESHTSAWDRDHANRTEVYTITDGAGQSLVYRERQTIHAFDWGEEVIEKIVDPDGAALTTAWTYYTDRENDGDNYSHLKQMVQPSGYCESYAYDSLGRVIEVTSPYLDPPSGQEEPQFRVATTIYGTNDPAVTVIETIQGYEVARRYTAYRPGETREIQVVTSGADWDDPANLVTITRTCLGGAFEGKLRSVTRPDGTMSVSEYEYVSAGTGSNLVTTVSTGQPNSDGSAIVNGTKTTTTVNQAGTTIREETYDIADGSDTLLTWTQAVVIDDFGRATQVDYSDGTSATTVYGCCGVLSTSDREGIATAYTYDALKRAVTTTHAGITTSNSYDAAGRVMRTVRIGADGSAITLNTSTYNVAGRLTSSTDGLTNATTHGEEVDGDGHTVKVTTYPDNSTRIDTYYHDGSLFEVTGSAVHSVRYEYGVDGDGQFIKEIKLAADGTDTTEWTKTYTDFVGRPSSVIYSDGAASHSYYNSKGQLIKQVDPDGVITLFAYNGKGELETTAIDMDRDGEIDYGGTDRITKTQSSVLTVHNTTVRRTTTSVWTTDNQDETITTAIDDVSVDGLESWTIACGLTNSVATVYDRPNARRTVRQTAPDGTQQVSVYEGGRLQSSSTANSELGTLNFQNYQYDSHGRLWRQTDARTGATTCTYDNGDQLLSVSTGGQTTSYQYDFMGRQTQITLPDDGTVTTEYFDTGESKKTCGARTHPIKYTYDYAGRLKTMKTWKDYAGNTGAASTTWNYDPQRGFLTSKVYDDSSSVTYRNSAAGRLLSRKWARNIVTTYGYNNAGQLASVSYYDGVTPSVASVYDRQGRRTSVTCGTNTCLYAYNDAGQLLSESFPNSGIIVSNSYDSLLRRSSLTVNSELGTLNSVIHGYDAASRLQRVSDGTHFATYSYVANSSLISNIVFATDGVTKMTTTRSYDDLNRLTSINSSVGVSLVSSHSYQYNLANQRTRVNLADGSYWLYQYDSLGQVTSGKKYWPDGTEVAGQQFGYEFDDIGNRKLGTVNGRQSTYTANSLNQYTQRTVPGAVDIFGIAASNATVTVNNQKTARKGEYFYKELSVPSSSSPAYSNVWIVGVHKNDGTNQQDIVTTVTGREYRPKTPEEFSYDLDGNLTSDGRWTYTWDGENRLIAMESLTNAPSPSKKKLEFAYDWRGRRIQKKVYTWNESHNQYEVSSALNFVYDGWNLIAELNAESGELKASYMWGLDLSGSEQGAGGVGGLLAVTSYTSPGTTQFVSYDGSGNVVALLDAQSATLSAQYDYGPFGETIRATGPAASRNPYRFSTKYADAETGLLYYGYRYYSATTGRWLNRDPIEESGGFNVNAFVNNDPVQYIDLVGLSLYAFDGTNNEKDRDAARGENTNVAILWQLYHRQGVKDKFYMPGVGTRDGLWNGFGNAFGLGFARRVEDMLGLFENQKSLGDCEVDILGFSRGAAEAREFANRIKSKYPDLKIRWLGLFDTVESVGGPATDKAGYRMAIPSAVGRAFQLVAGDEYRREFPLTSIKQAPNVPLDPRYAELYMYGAHSDIGGGYSDRRGLANRALKLMWSDGVQHGVPFDPIPTQYQDYSDMSPHDSREGWFYGDKALDWVTGRWNWFRGPRPRDIGYAPLPSPPNPLLGVGSDFGYY